MSYEPLQSTHSQLGEVRYGYSEWENNGPPLVLMHGITGNRHSFDCVIPYLMNHYRIFAIDHRGHGSTSHHPGKSSVHEMTGDMVSFIRHVIGQPVFVWGHSMGALVALKLAVQHPEWVLAIAAEDPPLEPGVARRDDVISVFQFWYDLIQEHLSVDEMVARLVEADDSRDEEMHRYKANNLKEMDATLLEQALDVDLWAEVDALKMVDHIQCPAFLMQADPEMGGLTGQDLATIPAFRKHNWRWKRYQDIGHSIHGTIPEEAALDVKSFFEKVNLSATP